jgi:hypothetical protein
LISGQSLKSTPRRTSIVVAKNKVLEATQAVVAVLTPLEPDERARAIRAAITIVGGVPDQSVPAATGAKDGGGTRGQASRNEKAYFDLKDPQTKIEELAVAARFREEAENAVESSHQELRAATSSARRNFDSKNFKRDLENARIAGLFNRGTGKDRAVLSHYGQEYVDALPNRDAVKTLKKPKGAGAKRAPKRRTSERRKP